MENGGNFLIFLFKRSDFNYFKLLQIKFKSQTILTKNFPLIAVKWRVLAASLATPQVAVPQTSQFTLAARSQ